MLRYGYIFVYIHGMHVNLVLPWLVCMAKADCVIQNTLQRPSLKQSVYIKWPTVLTWLRTHLRLCRQQSQSGVAPGGSWRLHHEASD